MADEIVNETEAKELKRAEDRKIAADKRDEESKGKQAGVEAAMADLYGDLVQANQAAAESERAEIQRAHEKEMHELDDESKPMDENMYESACQERYRRVTELITSHAESMRKEAKEQELAELANESELQFDRASMYEEAKANARHRLDVLQME